MILYYNVIKYKKSLECNKLHFTSIALNALQESMLGYEINDSEVECCHTDLLRFNINQTQNLESVESK